MRNALRVLVGLGGLAGAAVGISSLTKLVSDHLDSPRWFFLVAGLVALGAGASLLWIAVIGLAPSRRA